MPGELQIPDWTWWIVLYIFAGGVAGGAYFTSALIELTGRPEDRPIARMGYYLAFPLWIVCGIALIADLGRQERFWHMLVYSKTLLPWPKWDSPISIGSYALAFFGLFSFLSFLDALVETGRLRWAPLRLKYNSTPRKIYAIVGGFFGFFLASYTGVLLATTHLPVWSTNPLLGALFLASAASTGMAAIALGLTLTRQRLGTSIAMLERADSFAILVEIVLLVAFVALLGAAAPMILSGTNGLLLIGGTVIIGLLIPLALQFRARTVPNAVLIASVLVLIGGFVMRTVIVMGGQGLL
jgi:protein NrfD